MQANKKGHTRYVNRGQVSSIQGQCLSPKTPNPRLHLHQCGRLDSIPGSGTSPGEGNGSPLQSSRLDVTKGSEGPLRQAIAARRMRGGDGGGGHRASGSWAQSPHGEIAALALLVPWFTHRELELVPRRVGGRRGRPPLPLEQTAARAGRWHNLTKKGRSHAARVIWQLLNESGTALRGAAVPVHLPRKRKGPGEVRTVTSGLSEDGPQPGQQSPRGRPPQSSADPRTLFQLLLLMKMQGWATSRGQGNSRVLSSLQEFSLKNRIS